MVSNFVRLLKFLNRCKKNHADATIFSIKASVSEPPFLFSIYQVATRGTKIDNVSGRRRYKT